MLSYVTLLGRRKKGAFWCYVTTTVNIELIDKKANVVAVFDFINENKTAPPGVETSVKHVVGVRRK
jgi:hypothetical protein